MSARTRPIVRQSTYRWLLLGFVCIAALQALLMWVITPFQILISRPSLIDFSYYYVAALSLRLNAHANIYDPAVMPAVAHAHHLYLTLNAGTFNYPLLLPIVVMPLTLLGFDTAARIWFLFNVALWILNTVLLLDLFWYGIHGFSAAPTAVGALLRPARAERRSLVARWRSLSDTSRFTLAFGGLICVMFAPLVAAQRLGQASMLMLTCFLLALWLLRRARPELAGVALAIPILIKVFPAFLLLYFLMRRQWRVALGAVGGVALLVAAFIAVVGLSGVLLMRDIFTAVSSGVMTTFQNVSLARAPMWIAIELGASPTNAVAAMIGDLLMVAVALAFVSVMLLKWRRERRAESQPRDPRQGIDVDEVIGYCWALATMTLVSPINWEHYLIWLLPVFMLSLGYVIRRVGPGLRDATGRLKPDVTQGLVLLLALLLALNLTFGDLPFDYDGETSPHLGPTILGHPMRPLFMLLRPTATLLIWLVAGILYMRQTAAMERPEPQERGVPVTAQPPLLVADTSIGSSAPVMTAAAQTDIPWQLLFSVLVGFLGFLAFSGLIERIFFALAGTAFPK